MTTSAIGPSGQQSPLPIQFTLHASRFTHYVSRQSFPCGDGFSGKPVISRALRF